MPQYIEHKPGDPHLFIDGCYHGKWAAVNEKLNLVEVVKPRPIAVTDNADFESSVFDVQIYLRKDVELELHPTKDAKRKKIKVFDVFVLQGMPDKDVRKELIYMLLRMPAKRNKTK